MENERDNLELMLSDALVRRMLEANEGALLCWKVPRDVADGSWQPAYAFIDAAYRGAIGFCPDTDLYYLHDYNIEADQIDLLAAMSRA